MTDINDYTSRWNYMADKIGHPRKPILDAPHTKFQIVGTFVGDWDEELDKFLEKNAGEGYNFLSKKTKDDSAAGIKTKELNEFDMNQMGLGRDYSFVNKIRNIESFKHEIPTIWKMKEWFGFEGEVVTNIHLQYPGHVFPFHFDNLITVRGKKAILEQEEVEQYARVEVMLRDWDFGHVWGIGNTYWSNWRKGEIMWHPWHDVPHGTANSGRTIRVNLQVTGRVTQEKLDRLKINHGNIILT